MRSTNQQWNTQQTKITWNAEIQEWPNTVCHIWSLLCFCIYFSLCVTLVLWCSYTESGTEIQLLVNLYTGLYLKRRGGGNTYRGVIAKTHIFFQILLIRVEYVNTFLRIALDGESLVWEPWRFTRATQVEYSLCRWCERTCGGEAHNTACDCFLRVFPSTVRSLLALCLFSRGLWEPWNNYCTSK